MIGGDPSAVQTLVSVARIKRVLRLLSFTLDLPLRPADIRATF